MSLLDFAREHGVAMGSLHHGRRVGWTTNDANLEALSAAGASVIAGHNATGPRGWEISFPASAEVVSPADGTERC